MYVWNAPDDGHEKNLSNDAEYVWNVTDDVYAEHVYNEDAWYVPNDGYAKYACAMECKL